MIYGLIHPGSGLGNQLHRYVATRVLALEKGYDYSFIGQCYFKGKEFLNLFDFDEERIPISMEEGGRIANRSDIPSWNEWDKHTYDPNFNFVQDNTIIDGNFEDSRYFERWLPEIKEWLQTEPLDVPDDTCVIGFRGGEYYTVPELGLPKEYYDRAIEIMKQEGITKFEVHTDDTMLAHEFFPDFPIIHDISKNWRATRYAKHAIIANSSFYVLPRLMNGGLTIAPRYWNRYNTKKWDYPQNYYKSFRYI